MSTSSDSSTPTSFHDMMGSIIAQLSKQTIQMSPEDLEEFKCVECHNYLSMPPISFTSKGFECGRCTDTNYNMKSRVKLVEKLMAYILFPCQWAPRGCSEKLAFGEVDKHERFCGEIPVICPFTTCQSPMKKKELMTHWNVAHPHAIMKSNRFYINPNGCLNHAKIINVNGYNLLLNYSSHSHEECCVSVQSLCNVPFERFSLDAVEYGTENSVYVGQAPILPYPNLGTNDVTFYFSCLRHKLGATSLNFDINFVDPRQKQVCKIENSKVLGNFECCVCQEYMISPIHSCVAGHNICDICKNKVKRCPLCKGAYNKTRNLALENLAEEMIFNCKNRKYGCEGYFRLKELSQHENICCFE